MSKTKELFATVAPGVAVGLLALYASGVIASTCLANAAAAAVPMFAVLSVCTLAVDASRAKRSAVTPSVG